MANCLFVVFFFFTFEPGSQTNNQHTRNIYYGISYWRTHKAPFTVFTRKVQEAFCTWAIELYTSVVSSYSHAVACILSWPPLNPRGYNGAHLVCQGSTLQSLSSKAEDFSPNELTTPQTPAQRFSLLIRNHSPNGTWCISLKGSHTWSDAVHLRPKYYFWI